MIQNSQLETNQKDVYGLQNKCLLLLNGAKGATQSIENITDSQKQSPCYLLG